MARASSRGSKPPSRRRLDPEKARALILDATEKRLVTVGPSGIRLQEVAADAGVSHPTVLHHFGSREQLVKAVIARSLAAINAALVQALRASSGEESQFEDLIQKVGVALEGSGHGRVMLWLALEGLEIDGAQVRLDDVVEAAHELRLAQRSARKRPTREDTASVVVLASLALVCGSVILPNLLRNAGLGGDPRAVVRFRRWFARLLIDHLDR